jgi:hypothetical protein
MDVQKEAVALPRSALGLPGVPLSDDGLMRRLEIARRATAVRERVEEVIDQMKLPLPAGLRTLQGAVVEHLDDLHRRAEGVEKGLALAGPEGLRMATFGGMGSLAGGGGVVAPTRGPQAPAPAPPPPPPAPTAPTHPAPPPVEAPKAQGESMDAMFKEGKPTLPGFENAQSVTRVDNDPKFIGAPAGFAVQAGGSTLKMQGGNISLEAPGNISLKAASVTIEAPMVMVKASMLVESAGTITEAAGTIVMNAAGAIIEVAGIITLN